LEAEGWPKGAAIVSAQILEEEMKRIILATASVLALGLAGAGAGFAAGTGSPHAAGSNTPAATGSSTHAAVNPTQYEIRQAQEQLRKQGLYNGAIDGILGPETQHALDRFQQKNGLSQTATLDQPTMDKLFGNAGVGQGSTLPQNSGQTSAPMANPHPASPGSNLGNGGTTYK
jgi:peptidoglycan hydrolase-like protein with peptidoglycan-binding domain